MQEVTPICVSDPGMTNANMQYVTLLVRRQCWDSSPWCLFISSCWIFIVHRVSHPTPAPGINAVQADGGCLSFRLQAVH